MTKLKSGSVRNNKKETQLDDVHHMDCQKLIMLTSSLLRKIVVYHADQPVAILDFKMFKKLSTVFLRLTFWDSTPVSVVGLCFQDIYHPGKCVSKILVNLLLVQIIFGLSGLT